MDFSVECGIGERLMGKVMRLEIMPDNLDVFQFGRVFGQPLDCQPVLASGERGEGNLADRDRPIILDQHDRFVPLQGIGP